MMMINDDGVNNTKVRIGIGAKLGVDRHNCPSISVGSVGLVR